MNTCPNCGTELVEEMATCFICGSPLARPPEATATPTAPGRSCPACGKQYPADYRDAFCTCGVELTPRLAATAAPPAGIPAVEPSPRPAPGTRCLVLYGPDRKPARYFPLTRDVTLIGRVDVVQGSFPDIDVDTCAQPDAARKVSRRHALVLHSRSDDCYVLRPLGGNTGTQIEVDMVPALADYPLAPGTHIILGGAVRFKFEVV
jgi:hypothetical protein